ncbi:hypothetical protein NQ820_07155 [Acinetobacter baumannii]|nr:hypothetical protein [Acinetobacter baumannii]MDC4588950.1 hypothetical protein [Acinetobacter baumannii]MDC4663894.1 hypothetical protein [Acinetobacter baumannii]MDC4677902.1 hypothetical protein [Acinetobacter baumannii]MDC4701172.1 hypothetical protein [Acinetobacter baumannii]
MEGDKDLSKAEYYYRLAANKNHDNAQLQLALILLNSKKSDNLKEAKEWLEKASLNGNIEAKDKLTEIENK